MINKMWIGFLVLAVFLVGSATNALAADVWQTPAEIVASLTGKPVDQVITDRQAGKTYSAQAAAAGKLDEFKKECLTQYKMRLKEAVKLRRLTQDEADKLYNKMVSRMDTCDGNRAGCGLGEGRGQGRGMDFGAGKGFYGAN